MASALAEKVHSKILQDLLKGQLMPGDILNRRQLASDYGVSVTPVLEAITQLEFEGFLETLPRKGTRVKPITRDSLVDNFMLRDAIETKAARIYFGRTIRENHAPLAEFAARVDSAAETNLEDWKVEIAFHHHLVALAGFASLVKSFEQAMHLNLFYGMTKLIPMEKQIPRDNHSRLIENLADAGTADEAGLIIRKHVWYGKEYVLESTGRKLEEI